MALHHTSALMQFYQEIQSTVAVIFGMVVQFIFGDRRTLRMFMLIVISSVFVAMYIVPSFIDLLTILTKHKIDHDSRFAITLYALSSLLSMEILAFIIKVLPSKASAKLSKFLGIQDGKFKQ